MGVRRKPLPPTSGQVGLYMARSTRAREPAPSPASPAASLGNWVLTCLSPQLASCSKDYPLTKFHISLKVWLPLPVVSKRKSQKTRIPPFLESRPKFWLTSIILVTKHASVTLTCTDSTAAYRTTRGVTRVTPFPAAT